MTINRTRSAGIFRRTSKLVQRLQAFIIVPMLVALAGCGDVARHSVEEGSGPNPVLPPPKKSLLPTVKIAPAKGWTEPETPRAAQGMHVNAFHRGLDHPRWLYVLPNGDVLVAETNSPANPKQSHGIREWARSILMKNVGAGGPSADRISLLRDTDGDGTADFHSVLLQGLHSPFGMALIGDQLYVANTDAIVRFTYNENDTRITSPGVTVTELPAGDINHHWTKNLLASNDGRKLYVTVGSNSNIAENGMQAEHERAAILEVDVATGARRIFASGLRNPNGMAWEPTHGTLWTVVNERDEIGSDLVPDYLTQVHDGGFYGWPYSYFGQHIDERVEPQRPDLVASAIVPDYALGAHTASLGLAYSTKSRLPAPYADGMFIGQHGSWNRKPLSGYKVVFVPFTNGRPADTAPIDVLTGFVDAQGNANGRPVGVVIDAQGALLVADDVGNVIWRVTPKL
jgi:glucose/arabinose dehydrogenase